MKKIPWYELPKDIALEVHAMEEAETFYYRFILLILLVVVVLPVITIYLFMFSEVLG